MKGITSLCWNMDVSLAMIELYSIWGRGVRVFPCPSSRVCAVDVCLGLQYRPKCVALQLWGGICLAQ